MNAPIKLEIYNNKGTSVHKTNDIEYIYANHIVRFRKWKTKDEGTYLRIHTDDMERFIIKMTEEEFIKLKQSHEKN